MDSTSSRPADLHNHHPTTPPQAVLFDHDGILVNSEPLHRLAWERTFQPLRVAVSDADYAWSVGRLDLIFAEAVIRKHALTATPQQLADEKRRHVTHLLAHESQTFQGIPQLVRRLAQTRPLGIVSSAMREEISITLRRFRLDRLFTVIVAADDVTRHKPDPEPYLLCATRLRVPPGNCVVLEDSPSGIEAARRAGMRVVAVTNTFSAEELPPADALLESLADTDAVIALIESFRR